MAAMTRLSLTYRMQIPDSAWLPCTRVEGALRCFCLDLEDLEGRFSRVQTRRQSKSQKTSPISQALSSELSVRCISILTDSHNETPATQAIPVSSFNHSVLYRLFIEGKKRSLYVLQPEEDDLFDNLNDMF